MRSLAIVGKVSKELFGDFLSVLVFPLSLSFLLLAMDFLLFQQEVGSKKVDEEETKAVHCFLYADADMEK